MLAWVESLNLIRDLCSGFKNIFLIQIKKIKIKYGKFVFTVYILVLKAFLVGYGIDRVKTGYRIKNSRNINQFAQFFTFLAEMRCEIE